MELQNHISASCIISNNVVLKNGTNIFSNPDADLNTFFTSVYQHLELSYPKFYKMDNLSKLGWLAAEVLLKNSYDKARYQPTETGIVLTNANSSLDADVKYWNSVQEIASPSLFVYTLPNIVVGEICIRNGFKGEDAFYITPEFDAAFIHQQVSYLLDNNIINACICGWADVFGTNYKAALYLIECGRGTVDFNIENLNNIFKGNKI